MAANNAVADPHVVDENPEEQMGAVTLDPWEDKSQLDWPQNDEEANEEDTDEQDSDSDVVYLEDDRENVKVID